MASTQGTAKLEGDCLDIYLALTQTSDVGDSENGGNRLPHGNITKLQACRRNVGQSLPRQNRVEQIQQLERRKKAERAQ